MATAIALTVAGACSSPARTPRAPRIAASTRQTIENAQEYERARRYDLARAAYARAVAEAPDRTSGGWAARQMARALVFWGEYVDAEKALERTVELVPGEFTAWHDLGMVREELRKLPQAEAAFRRSIALRPRLAPSRIALAALLVNQRRWQEALVEYDHLLALDLPERLVSRIEQARKMIRAEMGKPP